MQRPQVPSRRDGPGAVNHQNHNGYPRRSDNPDGARRETGFGRAINVNGEKPPRWCSLKELKEWERARGLRS